MDDRRCSTCAFWEPPPPEKGTTTPTDVIHRWSECRRYPPVLLVVFQNVDYNSTGNTIWNYQPSRPATKGSDFCGEWNPS